MKILTVTANIKVPTVPNFLLSDGDMKFPLSAFDDNALRQIAETWTVDLLNNANRQRIEARNLAWYEEIRAEGGRAPGYLEKKPRVIVERPLPETGAVTAPTSPLEANEKGRADSREVKDGD